MLSAAEQPKRYTYADYLTWDDDARRELIDGRIFVMSPAPSRRHLALLTGLLAQVAMQIEESGGPCEVYPAPFDVRLPADDEEDGEEHDMVQPDLVVICDPSKLDERGACGAPDWLVEILSPSTAGQDQIRKRTLYEQHGVREYWLVHPQDRLAWIYRLGADRSFAPAEVAECTGSSAVAAVPGLVIDWDRAFARVPRDV